MTERFVTIKQITDVPASMKDIVSFTVVDDKIEGVTIEVGEDVLNIAKSDMYGKSLQATKVQGKRPRDALVLTGESCDTVSLEEAFLLAA